MHEITVEPSFSHQLGNLAEQAVLCDASGRVLGFFSPTPGHPLIDQLQLEPALSIAETQKLRNDKTGKPLDEILSRLGIS